jgi:hypothetical protein
MFCRITFTSKEISKLQQGKQKMVNFVGISNRYQNPTYQDIANHPAIVLLPNQVSTISISEYYRIGIPLIVPSLDLLSRWHLEFGIVTERTWERMYKPSKVPHGSPIPQHPKSKYPFDPNDDSNVEAIKYWLSFSDFYQWPHITTFDSAEDLLLKLNSTDFQSISQKMKSWDIYSEIIRSWETAFHHMFDDVEPGSRIIPSDFDEAMWHLHYLSVPMNGHC